MSPLFPISKMIAEWRKGCSNTLSHPGVAHSEPETCPECTKALILAIEEKAAELERYDEFLVEAMAYCERSRSFDHDAGLLADMNEAYRRLYPTEPPSSG